MVLRCYVRLRIIKSWGLDDTFILIAFVGVFISRSSVELNTHTSSDHAHVVHWDLADRNPLWDWPTDGRYFSG